MGRLKEFAVVSETTGKVLGRYLEDKVTGCLKKFCHLSYGVLRDGEVVSKDLVMLTSTQRYIRALKDVGNDKFVVDGTAFGEDGIEILMVLQDWEVEPVQAEPV